MKKRRSELDKLTKKTAEDASGNQKSLTQPSIVGLFSAASKASADAADSEKPKSVGTTPKPAAGAAKTATKVTSTASQQQPSAAAKKTRPAATSRVDWGNMSTRVISK